MSTKTITKLGVELTLDSGKVLEVREGDILNGLKYRSEGTVKEITGAVRVIGAATRSSAGAVKECPPEPYIHKYITILNFIIDSSTQYDAELTNISVFDIIDIESVTVDGGAIVVGPGDQFKPISDVIAEAEPGAVVKLEPGEYTDPIVIDKSITLVGAGDTVLSAPLTFTAPVQAVAAAEGVEAQADAEPISVVLENLTLTGDALISVQGVDEFTMKNCSFANHNCVKPASGNLMPISFKSETPLKLVIEGCTFGPQNKFSYNLIDVYGLLKTGSSISGNTFERDCCVHNQISLYGVEPGAEIAISNNHCVVSKNMVRFGMKGEPDCTIEMRNNVYDETEPAESAEWAGLFLVQPYGKQTTSFAKTKINVANTTMPDPAGQLAYLYAGGNDTPFTADNKPVVTVDGVLYNIPDRSA